MIYRKIHNIPDNLETAVNVQSIVFGNIGDTSGTDVAFTRNPSTWENKVSKTKMKRIILVRTETSPEDIEGMINAYEKQSIFAKNPFESIDQNEVGKLMKLAEQLGRSTRPDLKINKIVDQNVLNT